MSAHVVIELDSERRRRMNKDRSDEYTNCSAYFEAMKAAGYETALQGSAQGGVTIGDDATIRLAEENGLPTAAVKAAKELGAEDYRLGVGALLNRIASSQGASNHLEAGEQLKVANDVISNANTPSSNPKLN
jgi:hypothetical protein